MAESHKEQGQPRETRGPRNVYASVVNLADRASSSEDAQRREEALRASTVRARQFAEEYRSAGADPIQDLANLFDATPEEWRTIYDELNDEFLV